MLIKDGFREKDEGFAWLFIAGYGFCENDAGYDPVSYRGRLVIGCKIRDSLGKDAG